MERLPIYSWSRHAGLIILLLLLPSLGRTATSSSQVRVSSLDQRETQVLKTLTRSFEFSAVPHPHSSHACSSIQPPEALTTPDPIYSAGASGQKVKVSFIIGIDGRVHSPLILESAGLAGDRRVIDTVRTWRYRPATCNGVPTETEGKVEFSIR